MGRRFVGAELKQSYWEQARKNLASVTDAEQGDLFSNLKVGADYDGLASVKIPLFGKQLTKTESENLKKELEETTY